jgi:hypothetical protein
MACILDAAADDYRLILANQGVDPVSTLYSLAHLRLARVLVLKKKTGEARPFGKLEAGCPAEHPGLSDQTKTLAFARLG